MQEIITNTPEQTKNIAKNFAKNLKGGEIICLYGNLGAGKTTFTQGFCENFGVEDYVQSPTFVIMKVYETKNHKKIKQIYHIDAYRLQNNIEILNDLCLQDILGKKNNIIIIEWPENISQILKNYKTINIKFKPGKNLNQRKILIE